MSQADSVDLLASSSYLKFIMAFHIISAACGMIAMLFMEWNKKAKKLLAHKSLLLLMEVHNAWMFLICLTTVVNNSISLHAHLTMRHPSDIFVGATECAIRRSAIALSIYGSIFSQMSMAAERYRASQDLATYESTGVKTGHWLILAHLVLTFSAWLAHFFITGLESTAVAHCTIVKDSKDIFFFMLAFAIFSCELTTIVTFVRLLFSNFHLRDNYEAGLSLCERYQLTENIRMLKMLLPVIIGHSSLGMYGTTFFVIMKFIYPAPEMYPLIEESINMLHLQGIWIPLIFSYRLREERLHNQRVFTLNTMRGEEIVEQYTTAITQGW